MTPFLVECTRGERIGGFAADSLSSHLFLHKRPSFRMERSGMRNPEGLDAVNLFIIGYLFYVP